MLNLLKKHLKVAQFFLSLAVFAFLVIISTKTVFGQQVNWSNEANPDSAPKLSDLEVVFQNVVRVVAMIGGLALFLMFIFGGFKFLTSEGDPKALDSAKGTLTFAVLGLVAAIAGYFIIQIIANFTGIGLLGGFCVPTMTNICF